MNPTPEQLKNYSDEELATLLEYTKERVSNAPEEELSNWVRQFQMAEYEELRRVVEHGTPEQKRKLALKNHYGIGPVKWHPGRVNRHNTNEEQ